MSADKPSFIKIAKGAKVSGLTATDNIVTGNVDFINNEGSLENTTLENNRMYPGGETWVDHEYDPYFMELPPDEKFHRLKALSRWLKEHVLAAIIIFIITTILGIYINKWLAPPQGQIPPPAIQEPKAMPV